MTNYVGKRYDQADEQGRQTGDYTVLDLSLEYKIKKNTSTYLKINNLTNKDYQIVDGYASDSRSFYLGVKTLL